MIRISAYSSLAALFLAAIISFYSSETGLEINRTIGEAILQQGEIAQASISHNN